MTEAFNQNHCVGRHLQERSNEILPLKLFSQQLCVPGGTLDALLTISP